MDRVHRRGQGHAVVPVGSGQHEGERQASPIHDEVAPSVGLAAVGFGPVASPPFWRGRTKHRVRHATSRSGRPGSAGRACGGGCGPIGRCPAMRATCASTSSRCSRHLERQPLPADRRTAALRRHSLRPKQGRDLAPKSVGQKLLGHAQRRPTSLTNGSVRYS